MMYKGFSDMLKVSAEQFGDKAAFIAKKKIGKEKIYDHISYKRFYREVLSLSKEFVKRGYKGKRIAIIGKNCYEWLLAFFAAINTDSIAVPLDKGLSNSEINEQLKISEASALVFAPEFCEYAKTLDNIDLFCFEENESFDNILAYKNDENPYDNVPVDCDVHKMSVLLFTSGTTSQSKSVMLSQNNILSNVQGLRDWEDFNSSDVNLLFLPLHHTFGMVETILFLTYGITHVFCEGLRVQKALVEYKVTILVAVPLVLEMMKKTINRTIAKKKLTALFACLMKTASLLMKCKIDVRRKLFKTVLDQLGGGLRIIISGAAALDPETSKFFNNMGVLLLQGYGLTETSPVLAAENPENMRPGSIGKPLPNVDIKIANPDDMGVGELIATGPNVMLGYYNAPELTAEVIKDGYFYTGDMAYIDKDGFIFITGRYKNVIVLRNGKNVYPEELELKIGKLDYIKESVVINDDSTGKDRITAIIVPDLETISEEDAKERFAQDLIEINKTLADYKQIADFRIQATEFEKTTTGKIKRY